MPLTGVSSMKIRTVRLINERTGWYGLSVWDIAGIGYFLVLCHSILEPLGVGFIAFLVTGVLFLGLLSVRLRSRPKTIRDYLRSKIPHTQFSAKRSR